MDGQDSPIWNGTYKHSPVPVTFACADALGVPSIVSHLLVGDFSWPHPDVNVYPSEWQAPADMQLLASRSSPMLISVSTIVLHMNKKNATASGLFGLLGDETVQSVDFYDSGRLRAYYRSWADNCTKTDAWAKNLFKVLLCDSLKHYFRGMASKSGLHLYRYALGRGATSGIRYHGKSAFCLGAACFGEQMSPPTV